MSYSAFHHVDGVLHAEGVSAIALADQFGTPLYVYSRAALTHAYEAYARACAQRRASVHVAVKANSNLAVLNVFARLGAGFDIVSGGELARVLAAGGKPANIVFSGVGKSADEMREALAAGVKCFNVESIPELDRLDEVARAVGKKAPVSLRVNPDVDPKTHPYISTGLKANKFGVAFDEARAAYRRAATMPHLDVIGIDCHIGSQITEVSPYLDAVDKLLELVEQIEADGTMLHHIDVGGGLGITYDDETPPDTTLFVRTLLDRIEARGHGHREVFFEPGRSVTGNAGMLLTRVEFLKPGAEKNFAIVDAAMNDLARPAMYQAFHAIEPVTSRPDAPRVYDVVGPICESGDWLGRDRSLAIAPGDLLAIRSAGAYGFVMSSNYNTRPRAAEVMVDGDCAYLVRARETVRELFASETLLPE
ncbi:diaminopimelate decarboxylase [Trinickia sp. LjRoot230]|uniref:diaminopimelate decarboxylase n=1 Tax=Trinickia sp. LjRoot230 TaxID=3342288 RepID=UPI003ECC1A24